MHISPFPSKSSAALANTQTILSESPPENLTPEYRKALRILRTYLHEGGLSENALRIPVNHEATVENAITSYRYQVQVKGIPSEESWRWNQAKQKKTISLPEHNAKVVISKLIPRKKAGAPGLVPRLKMWHFTIESASDELSILWCERGHPKMPERPAGLATQLSFICN